MRSLDHIQTRCLTLSDRGPNLTENVGVDGFARVALEALLRTPGQTPSHEARPPDIGDLLPLSDALHLCLCRRAGALVIFPLSPATVFLS